MRLNAEKSRFWFTLAVPLLLMGLITMPHKNPRAIQEKNGIIDIDALIKQVSVLNDQKKHQQSLELLLAALEQQREDSLLKPLLLQTFDMFLENEVRSGEQEIKIDRKNIDAYVRMASALELLDNSSKALEILTNGVSINPDAPALWMKIGKLEHKLERPFEALDVFKEVIRLDSDNSDAYNNAAFVLAKSQKIRSKDLDDAILFAKNAHMLSPDNAEYLDTMAEVEFRQGNSAQAQSLIKQAIKLSPHKDFFKIQLKRFSHE
jgi:tetratricopeptide (TPR) repeat protein